jgi:hypothetical protein
MNQSQVRVVVVTMRSDGIPESAYVASDPREIHPAQAASACVMKPLPLQDGP